MAWGPVTTYLVPPRNVPPDYIFRIYVTASADRYHGCFLCSTGWRYASRGFEVRSNWLGLARMKYTFLIYQIHYSIMSSHVHIWARGPDYIIPTSQYYIIISKLYSSVTVFYILFFSHERKRYVYYTVESIDMRFRSQSNWNAGIYPGMCFQNFHLVQSLKQNKSLTSLKFDKQLVTSVTILLWKQCLTLNSLA